MLADFLAEVICLNSLENRVYFEPYAGGAGAALRLLAEGIVERIVLNDADYRIYAFWKAVLKDANRFVDSIQGVPLSVDEWRKQKNILSSCRGQSVFDVGFAAFFVNRCSRAGIISTSGPIGGHDQTGPWKINARYSPGKLADRVMIFFKK